MGGNRQWNGPTLVCTSLDEWPKNEVEERLTCDHEMRKQNQTSNDDVTFVTTVNSSTEDRLDPKHFSSWIKLTRVCTLVMRFVDNCRLPLSLRASGVIKPEEIVDAETHYIKLAQQEIFIEGIRATKANKRLHTRSKLLPLKLLL